MKSNKQTQPHNITDFFQQENIKALANAIPQSFLIINELGLVIFGSEEMRNLGIIRNISLTPVVDYHTIIETGNDNLIQLISSSLAHKKGMQRQFNIGKKICLAESKTIIHENKFIGITVSVVDISGNILKEKQHELLYQISSALSEATSLSQVLKVAVGQVMKSLNVTSANIMLFDEQTKTLKVRICTQPNHNETRDFKLGEGIAGKCAEELIPYSIHDVTQSAQFAKRNDDDKGALLVVPLMSRGRLVGVINVSDREPRYFTESEVQFLTIVANDIAIALENSQLYERLKHKARQLSKLFWVSSFSGVKTLDNRIQRMVKLIAEILDAEDCCIYIYSRSRNKLVLKYQKDIASPLPLQIGMDKPSLSTEVLFNQEVKVLNNLDRSPDPSTFKKYPQMRNLLCCPIEVNQQPIGIIHVINKRIGNFDEEDQYLLRITAHRIGTIIENAQLLRKVEAEKDLLDNIIRNTGEGVLVLDRKKRIIIWNRYLEELTGLSSTEVIGLPCHKILYSKLGLKKLTQQLYQPFSTEQAARNLSTVEEEMKTSATKEKIWLNAIYSHLFDPNRSIEYTIIVLRNISKEKEFIEAKDEFVSLATHELRTPLTAIKGYLSMILKGDSGTISVKQQDYFNKAYQATERLVVLVEELLDVARIDEDRVKLSVAPFPIKDAIEDCVDGYREKAQSKNITLRYSSGASFLVDGDPDKTKQIICNLIDNAIKYTKDKGRVMVFSEKQDSYILVGVTDNGVGIPPKYLNKIFDRFVRAPNSLSVKAGGTGLGLYIVKNLVEKQGGKIWVTSQIGKETTFYFTIPIAKTTPTLLPKKEEVP